MTITELIAEINARGIRVRKNGDDLVLVGAQEVLDASFECQVRSHKAALLDLLENQKDGWGDPFQITPEMLPLVQLTQEEIDEVIRHVPGGAANVQDIYSLAPLQEGILFHHLMNSEGDPYLRPLLGLFETRDHLDRFIRALQAVVDRHDILRTAVLWEGLSEPVQVVWREAPLHVEEVELDPEVGDIADQLFTRFHPRRFRIDVQQAPLLHIYITHDSAHDCWFMMQLRHHLIGDHSTLDVMHSEIEAHLLGKEHLLPPSLPFRNLIAQARLGVSREEHEVFFRKMLGDVDEPTAPFGLLDVRSDSTRFEEAHLELSDGLARTVRAHARRLGVSTASLCHLAWARVLSKVSGREDVVFGTVLFGRMQGGEGADRAMGLFINTLPIRISIDGQGVEAAVRQIHGNLAELLCHEHASLALAQRCSAVPAPTPLFSALLNYRHSPHPGQLPSPETLQAWEGIQWLHAEERTNYPFTLSVNDLGKGLSLDAQVSDAIGPMHVCDFMRTALESLVSALETSPVTPIHRLEVLPRPERHRILYEWNDTKTDFPSDRCVHELFEEQVRKTPAATAVVFEDRELSYAELNARANQLAHYLRDLGVRPDSRVAICVERGFEMIIALIAVLKAGGAYVPLDPAYPPDRLRFMLDDSTPLALLTQTHLQQLFTELDPSLPILHLDASITPWINLPHTNPVPGVIDLTPLHLAYVIYTSGSTGIPKGVMVHHRGLVNRLVWMQRAFELGWNDMVLQKAPFGFDVSVWEFFWPIFSGARLVIAKPEGHKDPAYLSSAIREKNITVLHFVPSMLESFLRGANLADISAHLRVVCSGEPLSLQHLRLFYEHLPGATLHNLYGPTEAAIDVTSWGCSADFISSTIPIGRPIANTQIYILDSYGEPVPVGVAGELYIGGAGVARGYLNRPELTAERFLKDPFVSEPDARMYRTGDLGRWLPDGNIEFLGRNDFQVKIRGYRIELGEIEARLMEHAAVREAVVMAREDSGGDKRLVAYYTATDTENGPGAEVLRAHLSSVLPEYMVPAAYVRLVALPLTPNGKLDRGALPTPDAEAYSTPGYEAPQGELETRLAQVWAEILGIDRVGRHDNFFQLGGHSLLAVRTATRLQHFLGVEVKIRDLFTCPVLADLARTLDAEKRVELRPITPTDRAVALPLSFAQQRLWFLAQMDEASTAYNISFGLRLKGQLDKGAFRRALDRILIRHEALRTTFAFIDERPVQRIAPAEESRFLLVEHDLRAQEGALAELERLAALEAEDIFDLECGPLIRGRLIRLGEDEHALLISMHHIVSDGWSMGVLLNELSTLYAAFLRGEDEPLPKLEIQYADYAVWQRKWIEGDVLQQQAEYWKIALTGIPVLLELPSDHPRPAQQNYDGAFENLLLDERLTASLKDLSRRHGTTLFMTLLAAWATLLSRLSGQHDIVIGAPAANRGRAEIENLIGFFINTLALRLDLSGSPSVAALLQQAKLQAVAAQQHQDLPFEQVVELINPVRSLSHSPLFQCVLNWQDDAGGELQLPGLEPQPLELSLRCVAKVDLWLSLAEHGNHIVGGLEYATSLFASATIQRYLGYFRNLLQAMVADDTQAVDRLPLLDEEERRRILYAWNDTKTDFPSDRCIHQLFEEQVEKSPNATAVVFEDRELSYAELNARANQLAHYLRDLGVRPDSRVAICVERGFEMIIALIAVLKAGGAYVPLDPAYPPDRLRFMLDDSTPLALLTQTQFRHLFAGNSPSLLLLELDDFIPAWLGHPQTNPVPGVIGLTPLHLAYVIYTSGSTGIPKGVMGHHRGLCNLVISQIRAFAVSTDSRVLQFASFSFDASISEIMMALCRGAILFLVPPKQDLIGEACATSSHHAITHATFPPAVLAGLPEQVELDSISVLIVAGETLMHSLMQRWTQRHLVINAYGPTEATICAALHRCVASKSGPPPIGRPIANTQIYILDSYGEPVPVGVAGELYIGGAGVARGYLNRPELTAERFLKDPFVSEPDARMYRTGDLGRWLPDGNIEFLGRNDFQVKIRGYRIELGEIEARLMEHAAVREAVVMAHEDSGGDKRLVAYYTATDTENGPGAEVLRAHLSSVLPEYMVPAAYVRLVALPLTPNGKLDRGALPTPDAEAYPTPGYEAPQGELETRLAQVWAEILGIDRVGRHDNFFQLGGHSLLAVRVIARVRRQLNIDISITELFAHPVLTELAGRFRGAAQPALPAITPTDRAVALPLSFAQQRLWFLAQMDEASTAYNISFGLRLKGQLDKGAFRRALDRILIRHEALRTTFAFIDERPVQRIAPAEESRFLLVEHDLRAQEGALAELERLAALEAEDIFDLECGPLIRGRLIRLGEDEHALLISMHHIVSDGWSMGVLLNELSTLYAAFLRGEDEPLPKLEIQYADYAVWQRKWIEGDVLQQQAEYWKIALTGIPVLLELPSDHPRPAQQNYDGAFENLLLDERLTASLKDLSRRHGTTLFMTLLAAWATLLSRLSGQHDIVIGAPAANRGRAEIENLIGFFINTLALRLDLSGSPSVAALLQQAKLQAVAAQQHQDLPFEQVVELINPVRSLSHSPLFQVMFAWQNVERTSLALPGLDPQPLELSPHRVAKFDLILSLAEHGNHIVGGLEYATSLFASATIQRYLGYFRNLLQAMVADDTQAVDRLPLLDEEERRRVLYEWNDTKTDFPSDRCIHQLFEEQVEKSPNATAVVFEDRELSYAKLNARANQLAHYLRDLGVRPDSRVAICVERGFEMIIALIAVLKAGGAYVPLDPAYPPDRLRFMLDDSTPLALLTQTHLQQLFTELDPSLPILHLDASITPWINLPHTNPVPGVIDLTPLHLAYVIYTSGSTGIPKGVMVHHRGLVNYLHWAIGIYIPESAIVSSSFSFDATITALHAPLLCGGSTNLLSSQREFDDIFLHLQSPRRNLFKFSPGLLDILGKQMLSQEITNVSVNTFVIGGEVLSPSTVQLWQQIQPDLRLVNEYGPTETVVGCLTYEISHNEVSSQFIPIGRPIANTQIYILDSYWEPVPVGVAGELYIGGAGVARGYLNRPELTAERFLKDPFVSEPDARMYRTGDLGRWLPDGNIEFLGRNDFQVKIRGYRIELGEIEARLMEHAAVREAVVMAREDSGGDKRLVAYYTATDTENGPGAEVLRAHLSSVLPEYMVPAAYVRLVALPLTPNGKLDRGALPTPDAEAYSTPDYEAPQGELETRLAQVWAEILGIDRVGRHDNFFQLGGHSLLAVILIERARDLGLEVDLHSLFATPTLATLATTLELAPIPIYVPPNRIPPGSTTITPEMLTLIDLTKEQLAAIVDAVTGGAENIQDIYPLAPIQEGILFHHLLHSQGDPYLFVTLITFPDRVDIEHYLSAMQNVIERHDILRTSIAWRGLPEPAQVVWRKASLPVEEVHFDPANGDIAEQMNARFDPHRFRIDVEQAPLLRIFIAPDPTQERWLMIQLIHHLAGDHSTLTLMREEITAYLSNKTESLASPQPFRTFIAQVRSSTNQQEYKSFFTRMLQDVDEPTAPFGLLDAHGDGADLEEKRLLLDHHLAKRIRAHCRRLAVSTASLFHLAWGLLLASFSNRNDIVFGTVLRGRVQAGAEADRTMGPFLNTLPIRLLVNEDGVESSIRNTHQLLADLTLYQHASLALVQRCSAVPAPLPLFSALLNYRGSIDKTLTVLTAEDRTTASKNIHWLGSQERTNYPFTFAVNDLEQDFELTAQTPPSVGALRVCEFMQTALQSIAGALETSAQKPVRLLEVLPAAERHRVLYEWNDTKTDFPSDRCIHELFEEQVRKTPAATAVVFEDRELSYAELNARANQLAHYLRDLGVRPDSRVAICMERGFEMIIALIAVLKAGGAYVPLDPAYPPDRLRFMLDDSTPLALLTKPHLQGLFKERNTNLSLINITETSGWQKQPESNPERDGVGLTPLHLAYIIYTSGSTGKPKGVMIPHRAVNRLLFNAGHVEFRDSDGVAFASSPSFDAATLELWAPLLHGARMVIVSESVLLEPMLFSQILRQHNVSILWLTVGLFNKYADILGQQFARLSYLIVGGDVLDPRVVARLLNDGPPQHLINGYGPTESTTFATTYEIKTVKDITQSIPIGKPIANTQIYILDSYGEPVPVGVAGELYIGGAGVARGYLNRPELTAERFLKDPFVSEPDARMYRTGDLGRWLPDGNIEFLGRNDFQVKIRGYRIELGEIEARLMEHAAVREAVVMAREDSGGDKRLVAYYTATDTENGPGAEVLRAHLSSVLPEYMVPAAYVRLVALPLTPNGKLDRGALPTTIPLSRRTRRFGFESINELAIADLFAKALGIGHIGIDDNFFELGGNSLSAIKLINTINAEFGKQISISALFEAPTVARLSAQIHGPSHRDSVAPILPLKNSGSEKPLFLLPPSSGLCWCYSGLIKYASPNRPLCGVQAPQYTCPGDSFLSAEELAARYIREIRTVQPAGPYHLAGWSSGGILAFTIATLIQNEGDQVSFLALFDTPPPPSQATDRSHQWKTRSNLDDALRFFGPEYHSDQPTFLDIYDRLIQDQRLPNHFTQEHFAALLESYRTAGIMTAEPVGRSYIGNLILFVATKTNTDKIHFGRNGWQPYVTGHIRVHSIDCDHNEVMDPGPLVALGPLLRSELCSIGGSGT